MKYFNSSFTDFFHQLKDNNNKEWFDRHHEIFTAAVDQPFKLFITHLLDEIKKIDNEIEISADQAVFRIYRDMRFANGQPPYKLFRSALISPWGRKLKTVPAFYLELAETHIKFGGGIYKLTPAIVNKINPLDIVLRKSFVNLFKSFEFNTSQMFLTYKVYLPGDLITSESLLSTAMTHWKEANWFNQQLKQLIN